MPGDRSDELGARVDEVLAARLAVSRAPNVKAMDAAYNRWHDLLVRLSDEACREYLARVREMGGLNPR